MPIHEATVRPDGGVLIPGFLIVKLLPGDEYVFLVSTGSAAHDQPNAITLPRVAKVVTIEILVIHVEQAFLVIEGAALVAILLSNGEQQPLDRERPVPSVSRGIDPGDVGALSDTSRALPSSSISSRSNPVDTRAEITYREESTSYLKFGTKGMNGTIVEVCPRKKAEVQEVEGHDFEAEGNAFDLIGRLPIFDPLCLDTKQMLGQARQRPVLRLSWSRGASPPPINDNERALFEGGSVSRTPLHCAKSKVKVKSPALEMFTKTGQMSNEEVAEAVSPGGHVTKRRAHSRPVELLESAQGAVVPRHRLVFQLPQERRLVGGIASAMPSPTKRQKRKAPASPLQKEFRPRDSGIDRYSSDEDYGGFRLHGGDPFLPSMPRGSTSLSTVNSSESDD
ncbi:uncharacterized protein B0H18DRAFT_1119826 [Fomitopsis serialis]|uniref:uncharacterized protein n=1 Tax=Fomitopsis serialis TaxID=139415 RepID=UPI002007DF8C|nr:uncharacterized protein B0H18DRAFT_1119826 [Neoantrodia serialis]KAH9924816.1 hypothetical protein B0H18DRAFT_1119826 [Neoantrodia serialis]